MFNCAVRLAVGSVVAPFLFLTFLFIFVQDQFLVITSWTRQQWHRLFVSMEVNIWVLAQSQCGDTIDVSV